MTRGTIRLDKVRDALRRMDRGRLLAFAELAIELLPPSKLRALVGGFVDVAELRGDDDGSRPLLEEVRLFYEASLRGKYYEEFSVNSQNYMDQSRGTENFTAELDRLLRRCAHAARSGPRAPVREAFEILFRLLRHIDEALDEVVFFADEAGVWALMIDWRGALPVYFRCLAETSSAEEFAREVDRTITDFARAERPRLLAAAHRVASAEQRRAMKAAGLQPPR